MSTGNCGNEHWELWEYVIALVMIGLLMMTCWYCWNYSNLEANARWWNSGGFIPG